ncbi:unnamed protein product [Moneuplotes crassus]|uniref:Uncharacterized protein n=1 Tax=Euplotes crassus TaxID=5936 RepID=A0AAD1U285_EUPCR|nr:unnamed protein product [Moneuplotes crassus]
MNFLKRPIQFILWDLIQENCRYIQEGFLLQKKYILNKEKYIAPVPKTPSYWVSPKRVEPKKQKRSRRLSQKTPKAKNIRVSRGMNAINSTLYSRTNKSRVSLSNFGTTSEMSKKPALPNQKGGLLNIKISDTILTSKLGEKKFNSKAIKTYLHIQTHTKNKNSSKRSKNDSKSPKSSPLCPKSAGLRNKKSPKRVKLAKTKISGLSNTPKTCSKSVTEEVKQEENNPVKVDQKQENCLITLTDFFSKLEEINQQYPQPVSLNPYLVHKIAKPRGLTCSQKFQPTCYSDIRVPAKKGSITRARGCENNVEYKAIKPRTKSVLCGKNKRDLLFFHTNKGFKGFMNKRIKTNNEKQGDTFNKVQTKRERRLNTGQKSKRSSLNSKFEQGLLEFCREEIRTSHGPRRYDASLEAPLFDNHSSIPQNKKIKNLFLNDRIRFPDNTD